MSRAPILDVQGLACGYGDRPVLENLNFTIRPGEFVGILGPNGTGKSTLLKTIARLLPPIAGTIAFEGAPLASYDARSLAKRMAYVPQTLPPDAGWRVEEIVRMGRYPYQRGWGLLGGDQAAVAEALTQARADDLAGRLMETLSGGQRQRVYLARALAQGAPFLLFDEPTAHLDLSHQLAFFHLVRAVMAARGVTAVAVLHDLNMAAQFCHRLLVLKEGMLLADGPPDEVLEPGLIEEAFGLAVQVRHHPETGLPYILPLQLHRRGTGELRLNGSGRLRGGLRARVHVVCGGGAGERLLPELYRLGFDLSVGVVNALDSDQVTASRLGLPVLMEAPFSAIAPENLVLLAEQVRQAEYVVVGNVAWGAGNVGNLRVLAESAAGPRILLVADQPISERDFSGGEATRLWEGLVASGARVLTQRDLLAFLKGAAHEG